MRRDRANVAGVLLASFLIGVLVVLATPVHACGCGAYIPMGGNAGVFQERALIRFDGRAEEITMGFSVKGSSDKAAGILSVPNKGSLSVGDHRLFEELDGLTRPRQETRYTLLPRRDARVGINSSSRRAS